MSRTPLNEITAIDPEVWDAIPDGQVDVDLVRRRGRQLRRRRGVVTAVTATAATALVAAVAWTAAIDPSATEDPASPADEVCTDSTTGGPMQETPAEPTPQPGSEISTTTQAPPESAVCSDSDAQMMEEIGQSAGLEVDFVRVKDDHLDSVFVGPSGVQVRIFLTDATPAQVTERIEQLTSERGFVTATVANREVLYRESDGPGDSAQWAFASAGGTRMVWIVLHPGIDQPQQALPASMVSLVQTEILPEL